jgi:hemin uptake protein HemP
VNGRIGLLARHKKGGGLRKLLTQSLNKSKMAPVSTEKTGPAEGIRRKCDAAADGSSRPPRRISSEDLLQGQAEVLISHGGETYRLRQTRSGKLILQK